MFKIGEDFCIKYRQYERKPVHGQNALLTIKAVFPCRRIIPSRANRKGCPFGQPLESGYFDIDCKGLDLVDCDFDLGCALFETFYLDRGRLFGGNYLCVLGG